MKNIPSILQKRKWSGRGDSNARHQPWQGCALPLSYARIAWRKSSRWRTVIICDFPLSASRFFNFFRFSKATPEFEPQEPKRAKRFSPRCPLPVLRVLLFKIPQDPSPRLPPALFFLHEQTRRNHRHQTPRSGKTPPPCRSPPPRRPPAQ
jgi:hypothetical protein